MNAQQILRQIQFLLRQQTWTTSVPVWHTDSVRVTIEPEREVFVRLTPPMAFVRPGPFTADREEPTFGEMEFVVRLATLNKNDMIGESVLIGSNRTGQLAAPGKGLLEIEEKMFDALALLSSVNGIETVFLAASAAAAEVVEQGYAAARDYQFRAWATADRYYHPGKKFSATAAGSGNVSLAWSLPGTRFDYRRMILRRAAGSTPPATATSGTGITLGGSPDGVAATSKTDNPGAGTFSYSLFVAYDEYGSSTDERFSEAVTATVVAT